MSSKASLGFNSTLHGRRAADIDASRAALTGVGGLGADRSARFDVALRLIEDGRWQAAFTGLVQLADDGHPQAARIALVFAQRGTSLFGGQFPASARQRERWQRAGE
jgi:hypothetical protein